MLALGTPSVLWRPRMPASLLRGHHVFKYRAVHGDHVERQFLVDDDAAQEQFHSFGKV